MCLNAGMSKCLLILFNIIFFLLGLALIIVGIVLLVDQDVILDYLSRVPINSDVIEEGIYRTSWLANFAYMVIAAGAIFFIIGGAGLFGACCKSRCLLTIYGTILFLIIVLEIAAGILAFVYREKVESFLLTFLATSIQKYYTGLTYVDGTITLGDDSTGISNAWDYAHVEFQCCGANNGSDFANANKWPGYYTVSGINVTAAVPVSCCKMQDSSKWPDKLSEIQFVNVTECIDTADPFATHHQGCYSAVKNKLLEYSLIVGIVAIVVGVVELLGLWAAISLHRAISHEKINPV